MGRKSISSAFKNFGKQVVSAGKNVASKIQHADYKSMGRKMDKGIAIGKKITNGLTKAGQLATLVGTATGQPEIAALGASATALGEGGNMGLNAAGQGLNTIRQISYH